MELRHIEGLVNGWVQGNHGLATRVVPIAEARAAGKAQQRQHLHMRTCTLLEVYCWLAWQ